MADARNKAKDNPSTNKSENSTEEPRVHPAVSEARDADANAVSPVQPIEVVRNVPEPDNEAAETVKMVNKPNLQENGQVAVTAEDDPAVNDTRKAARANRGAEQKCWNCANHGIDNTLDDDGVCAECGFEKDKLYNGNLEAEKARQRALEAAGY